MSQTAPGQHPRWRSILFSLVQSALMSGLLSGLAQLHMRGWPTFSLTDWLAAWALSWLVAFPAAMVFARLAQAVVDRWLGKP